MHLIVPMAGRSSRFPNVKPKWMLTHPNGHFMAIEAIRGLNLEAFERIQFVYLREHEEQHRFLRGFREEVEQTGFADRVLMTALAEPTRDQPETVRRAIAAANVEGPIFVKDSDNVFRVQVEPGNLVCTCDLNDTGLIKPANKSYVSTDERGLIVNIVEKRIISSHFCVGGYGFEDAAEFCDVVDGLGLERPRYISNVIYELILERGRAFTNVAVTGYSDWGTIQDWDRFKRGYATLFLDVDGTLVRNSSAHFPPYIGESDPIQGNVEVVRELYATGKFQVILTTSRPERFRRITEEQMARLGVPFDHLLMGLLHSKRIIVNDYSNTNPFKSCDAINLPRDSEDLREILRESLGVEYEDL